MTHMALPGSQGWIYGNTTSYNYSIFLSFPVNVSKCHELKGGVDNKVGLEMFYN